MLVPWRVPQQSQWPSNFSLSFKRGAKKGILGFRKIHSKSGEMDVVGSIGLPFLEALIAIFAGASLFVFKLQGCKYSFQGLGGNDQLI